MVDAVPPSTRPPGSRERWIALDQLRFLAIVMMVQGHAFTSLLDVRQRTLSWYRVHDYVHGFTAPLFFFSSGVAFAIATLPHWQRFNHWGATVAKRLERYAWLLFIGYALNLPELSLRRLWHADGGRAWAMFLKVDALHNIAVTLALVQLLALRVRSPRRLVAGVAALGAAAVLAGPMVWRWPLQHMLPWVLVGYANPNLGALFPLIPWMGFLCAGIVTGALCLQPDLSRLRGALALRLGLAGLLVWLLGEGLFYSQINPFGPHFYWKTSPFFFLSRLGIVLMVFAALCAVQQWREGQHRSLRASVSERGWLRRIGQESLVIYVVHLLVLYGSPLHRSLDQQWHGTLGLGTTAAIALALLAFSVAMGLLWHRAKQRSPQRVRRGAHLLAALLVLLALLNPGSSPSETAAPADFPTSQTPLEGR